ncbi:tetraspanin-36-like [Pecten maximus]|uniref:tetraspanin-36-like n=1 Tax=Pecten maximus TaxID=6579 RepID=UPI001458DFE1|nr:tetraspanin-36-like [Pecten maximus]
MSSGCTVPSKICLIFIGLIFWGSAAGLFFVGGWVFETYKHFNELTTANLTLIPASIVLAVGVFMFIVGFLACASSVKENKCLLAVLFSILLVILTAEIAAGSLGYAFRDDMEGSVRDGLNQAINKYNGTKSDHQMEYLQTELKCCGVNNASDWEKAEVWSISHPGKVPFSCCLHQTNCTQNVNGTDIFQKGCLPELNNKFLKNLRYIAGIAVAFAVIQLLGMISSCVLFCRSKEVRYEVLGGPNSGLRV